MKRMTCFVMALALVLGLAQCKKEQLEPETEGNSVMITLNVGGGASTGSASDGSKAEVNPPQVSFVDGDKILVVSGGHYVGYLEKSTINNVSAFRGSITDPSENQPLYFYFLGNKQGTLETAATTCTVNISDQTNELPVISMGESIDSNGNSLNYTQGTTSFTARLHNHCSLMKFNVNTSSTAPICITGMNNQVTVNFADPTGTTNGFTYGKEDDGILKMVGGNAAERWLIVLPQDALEETGEAFSEDYAYFGTRPELPAIGASQCFSGGIAMEISTEGWNGNLSNLTASSSERYATATNGMTISGTLTADVKVSIADGASVTLNGANINNSSKSGSVSCAGITCKGNATINLYGGSINNINSSSDGYPGIQAGPSGNTLTIQGTGSLSAQGGSNAPGIGGGNEITCGNISLLGGQISACGGDNAPGIGSGQIGSCGNINISRNVEKITITGGSGASVSIGTNGGGTLTVDDVDDVSYINTDSFVYHPVNLSTLTSNYIAKCGDVLRGTLTNNVTISIDDEVPATVILSGANINYEGIVCVSPNVKAILFGTNSVIANSNPGIQAPASGTLTIDGSGSINVQSNAVGCAGIGGKINVDCGTINIKGGSITACGGQYGAGIGSGQNARCGDIEIEGGAITAEGGDGAAGIGSGQGGSCGDIEIDVEVTATAGAGAPNSIGAGQNGSCVSVTLPIPEGALGGLFSVSATKQVRFSRGNLQSDGTFAVNQYDNDRSKQLFKSDKWQSQSPSSDWYVLSPGEWDYLCHRSNKVGFATVNDIHGLIILPDDYSGSITKPYDFNNTTYNTDPWDDNIYSGDTWATMENNGVVFLPVTGTLDSGQYWSSSDGSNSDYFFEFSCTGTGMIIGSNYSASITFNNTPWERQTCSVRLVKTEETN